MSSNSSRLGVRGDETLGGGLHAIFQIEERYDASNSSNVTTGGETFVGLQGGWGTMKIGYFLTPYDDIGGIFGRVPTLITGILGSSAVWSNTGYIGNSTDTGAFDDRVGNSIAYTTPNMKGFTGNFQVAGRDTGGNDGGDTSPQAAPSRVDLLGERPVQQRPVPGRHRVRTAQQAACRAPATIACPTCQTSLSDQGTTAAGSYQWARSSLRPCMKRLKYDIATGGDLKRNMWGVSVTANWGPGQFYAGYWHGANGRARRSASTARVSSKPTRRMPERDSAAAPRVGARHDGRPDTSAQHVGVQLHVSAVEAHAAVRRLRDDRQPEERRLQLPREPDRRRLHGQQPGANGGWPVAARPTVRKASHSASSTSSRIPGSTEFASEVQSDHTGAFGRPFFSPRRAAPRDGRDFR